MIVGASFQSIVRLGRQSPRVSIECQIGCITTNQAVDRVTTIVVILHVLIVGHLIKSVQLCGLAY